MYNSRRRQERGDGEVRRQEGIFTKVAEGIHKPKELLTRALEGDVPVFHSKEKVSESESSGRENVGKNSRSGTP